MTLPVIVYGNGDLYRELFNAIATAFNDKSYRSFIDLSILLAGTWAIVRYSAERNLMVLVRWLMIYYFAFYIVFIPKTTVEIIDRINPGKAYAIDHVPLGLGLIANFTSVIGDRLTTLMEKNFSLPDNLMYGKTGMVMASHIAVASTQFEVLDANFNQSLQSFVHQCVFYDLLLNKYSWNDLLNASNIWQFVASYASPARAFVYYGEDLAPNKKYQKINENNLLNENNPTTDSTKLSNNTLQIMTCKAGISLLNQDWKNAITQAADQYGQVLFPNNQNAKAQLLSYLSNSYEFLTNISDSATTLMQQNMMANALQNGIWHMGASLNAPAALEAYSFVKAQSQKRLTNMTIGDMAAYWLPIMQNVLQATLYGSFVFIFLLLLFPFGPGIIKNYVISLLWLQLWAPLYAILNLFMNFYAQSHSLSITQQMGLTLSNQAGLTQVNADVASLAGYLSLSVPLLAAGLMKGMMAVFSQAAQYIAGVTQSVASHSAGEAISGNLSLGNTQFSNHSSFNTSANHFDTNARVFSGMFSYQMDGGSSLSITPSGAMIMNNQSAISNLGISVTKLKAIREIGSEQAETAYSAGLSSAYAYSDSASTMIRNLNECSEYVSNGESNHSGYSLALSAGTSDSLGELHQISNKLMHDFHFSQSTAFKVMGAFYASAQAGIPFARIFNATVGLKGEADITKSWDNRKVLGEAEEYLRNTNFVHNVDTALRGVREEGSRVSDEKGERLFNNIGSSYDHAQQLRHDMTNHFQQAESYRKAVNYAEEHGATINSNASQAFMNELIKNENLSLRDIENQMVNDQQNMQKKADQFFAKEAKEYLENFHHTNSSPEHIHAAYVRREEQIKHNERSIPEMEEINKNEVATKAQNHHLTMGHQIERKAVTETNELIPNTQSQIHDNKNLIDKKGDAIKEEVNHK